MTPFTISPLKKQLRKNIPEKQNNYELAAHLQADRGEGVTVQIIAQVEMQFLIFPTGIHRTVLSTDHRVVAAVNHFI